MVWATSEGICVGTTVTMSDTPANQKRYPQHSNQKVGCGFPLAKLVVWFCVTTGAVLEVSMAAFTTSEWELARQLYALLQPDDVVVSDSAYGTYVDLTLVRSANADAVFRKHHARHCDFRRGKKLGIGDHKVLWQRPQRCPPSMSPADERSVTGKHRSAGSAFVDSTTGVSSQGNHFCHHLI